MQMAGQKRGSSVQVTNLWDYDSYEPFWVDAACVLKFLGSFFFSSSNKT